MIWDRYDILPNTAGQLPKATEVKLCYCQIKTRVFAINMFVGLKCRLWSSLEHFIFSHYLISKAWKSLLLPLERQCPKQIISFLSLRTYANDIKLHEIYAINYFVAWIFRNRQTGFAMLDVFLVKILMLICIKPSWPKPQNTLHYF